MAGPLNGKGKKLAKASLAKANTINFNIEGVYEDDRQKFQSMVQDLAITFDGNNNVLTNQIKDDVTLLKAKMDSLATLFGITFDASGNITAESYTTHTHTASDVTDFDHTHNYSDGTINDTADGTGVQTDTTRVTNGVN